MLAHCRQELIHGLWQLMLTPRFQDAYANGIVIEFADKVWRRLFLRLFVYMADYPEK